MKSVLRIFLLLFLTLLIAPANRADGPKAFHAFPRLTLWAWQMPERLQFIDPRQVAVAYLDQTIYVRDRVMAEPRLQPMVVAPGTQVIAVVRIEMAATADPTSQEARKQVAEALLRSANRAGVTAFQVDFDALKSQREFYRDVLRQVRAGMPEGMPLSITALASWCAFDDWIADLPIDEAVPMMFRMGQEGRWFGWQGAGKAIREPLCLGSLGVATDEPWPEEIDGKRLYVFGTRPWTPQAVEEVIAKAALKDR